MQKSETMERYHCFLGWRKRGVGLGDALKFHQEDFAFAMRVLRARAAGTV